MLLVYWDDDKRCRKLREEAQQREEWRRPTFEPAYEAENQKKRLYIYIYNIYNLQHSPILPAVLYSSDIHSPTTPFNPLFFRPNSSPPTISHFIAKIYKSLHSHSSSASLE